ncbi:TPA: FMN-binding negative transcriptional regulator [Yersinia enterocolitica]|nr:FMN-binding negative transcriptional regulator [Yersinia enterocolitica]HEN3602239.1 FMN-binding negative transcriptional regulator [Yersinia enterocolitica]HEN3621242.1 FMN-binding negative transcriptional regulator [Yersinia enterocolitica]HEN3630733.1 FMN-binding negative transcriptional regulator [Yersinia enterocolitica]HEN3657878.1 FMN-binding negative transcriptional regulator [Yersinia enterocolitica]
MYSPRQFQEHRPEVLHALIQQHPLGILVSQKTGILDAWHIPFAFQPSEEGAGSLHAHIARANPLWQDVQQNEEVLVIFRGENAYISPGWYPSKHEHHQQVPTWNYQAAHVRGKIIIHDDKFYLHDQLAQLTKQQESMQEKPWQIADAPEQYINAMIKAIVGVEIVITELTGVMKLSQNKSDVDATGASENLIKNGNAAIGQAILAKRLTR